MNWAQLFSSKRLGIKSRPQPNPHNEGRSEFQRDFDRVIFSSAFRRLQSKTQVVPLPENDFVHTRLTHSLEASCVGRSLGKIAGDRVINKEPELFRSIGVTATDFESVVAAACLAHDIGNPPFGHAGEDAISEYFKGDLASKFVEGLTESETADLQNFEGNAAGFRLLTYTAPTHSETTTGMGLTFASLGAFTKYPKGCLPKLKHTGKASEKKYGFFQAEKQVFSELASDLGLPAKGEETWQRHPLAFLVEAADDICYSIIDFEDGYKLGRLDFQTVEGLFLNIIGDGFSKFKWRYGQILDPKEKIGFLRAIAINTLVWETADLFTGHLDKIMSGEFDKHLADLVSQHATLQEISQISVAKLYQADPIIKIEVAGFEVLSGLLDTYLQAIFQRNSKQAKMVRHLIPDKYLDVNRQPFERKYDNIINITLLVAGMTDTYAIDLYRKIKGISL